MTASTETASQVYQVYIKAPAERVWEMIATPEMVGRFFQGAQLEGSYEVGNRVRTWAPDRSALWGDNEVLECDPPRKLVHTWRSLYDPEMATEPESRVSWEIEDLPGGYSRLTLVHDRLEGAPKTAASIGGWTYYLSNLKTVLETGESLPPPP